MLTLSEFPPNRSGHQIVAGKQAARPGIRDGPPRLAGLSG